MADTNQTIDWKLGGKPDWESWAKSYFASVSTTQVLCKDGKYDYESNSPNARYDHSKTCINNGGRAETFTNVKCNDGSTQSVGSNPMGGRVDMPCRNNGGVSKNQQGVNEVKPNLSTLKNNETFLQKNKNNLLIVGVLVLGYLAYKKFKK